MENSIWRRRARRVAYVDLAVSVIAGVVVIALIAFFAKATWDVLNYFGPHKSVIFWWSLAGLPALITGLHLWTTLMLLIATFERDVKKALELTRIWRNAAFGPLVIVVVIVFVVDVLLVAAGKRSINQSDLIVALLIEIVQLVIGIGYIIWRGTQLFAVYKFIEDLETAAVADSAEANTDGAEEGGAGDSRLLRFG